MTAYDEIEWKKHIESTISEQEGEYPENEVMISEWSLEQIGITDPEIGMKIPFSFVTLDGRKFEQEFVLSGYYQDYIYRSGITPNSGNTIAANCYYIEQGSSRRAVGNIVVSEAFAKKYGTAEGMMGTCRIDDRLNSDEALELLAKHTGRKDMIVIGLTKNFGQTLSAAILPFACVVLIIIAGYFSHLQCGEYFGASGNAHVWSAKNIGCNNQPVKGNRKKAELDGVFYRVSIGTFVWYWVFSFGCTNCNGENDVRKWFRRGSYESGVYFSGDLSISCVICIYYG